METITDPAAIRATDEPDPFRRNPVRRTGPDDPWRFTRFVADDHECVIVRDEYDEPAPFGSCSTHRRALSSPVALGCTTPAPVGAAVALDLDAIEARANAATEGTWRADSHSHIQNGCRCLSCYDDPTVYQLSVFLDCEDVPRWDDDATRCTQSGFQTWADADFAAHAREDVPALVAEVRRLTARSLAAESVILDQRRMSAEHDAFCRPATDRLVARAEAAEAEVVTLRDTLARRTDSHTQLVRENETLRAKVAAVQALAEKRDVLYPPKWAFGAEENYCNGYRQARADFIAALAATGEGQ